MGDAPVFDQWLKHRRKALGLTQDALARQVGCATITIQKLEAGALRPSAQIAARLARHLELAPEDGLAFLAAAQTANTPLHTPGSRRSRLPAPPTPLLGRGPFIAAVCAMLQRAEVRLVTLSGPPGVGKTRVALQVAYELQATLHDGAVFVALAPMHDPDLVLASIVQALDLPEVASQSCLERLTTALHASERLLVLDNFEQVMAAAPALSALLEGAPALKVLVTSRAALHLSGEHQVRVPPLAMPDLHDLPPLAALAQVPAVALFVQRAQAVAPGFVLQATNAGAVAAVCQRLDGLPLAIELAAARSVLFTPQALLERLQSPLAVLTGGARDRPAHQQTLRSTIAWSYDLLQPREQALFARLGVFVGSFTSDAVTAICTDAEDGALDVLDSLALLLDESLLQHELGTTDEVRLRMLETIHNYALEQLTRAQEGDGLRERHARYYVQFTEQAEAEVHGPQQVRWSDRLEQEHENICAAISWSLHASVPDVGLRLVGALWWFWITRGHTVEGQHWCTALLPLVDRVAPALQARALLAIATLASYHGQSAHSVALLEQSADLSRHTGNRRDTSVAWTLLGLQAAYRGERAQAAEWHRQSLAIMRESGDIWGLAEALGSQGISAFNLEQFEQAAASLTEALGLFRTLGDVWSITYASTYLGLIFVRQGDDEAVTRMFTDSSFMHNLDLRVSIPEAIVGLAATALIQGQVERAARLAGAADVIRERFGTFISPIVQAISTEYIARARSQLDEQRFTEAWEAGRAMSFEQVIAYAVDETDTGANAAAGRRDVREPLDASGSPS
ncbi:MAG: XRE family transcriptional regulator [Chloroflexales bacterium]|nr:XRE family transcriptional regulator [Chloroflexales bacterium]